MKTWLGFADGQRVTHRSWKNRAGDGPATGTVRVFDLSAEDVAENCARTEVCWDDSCVADELDLVAGMID